VTISRLLLYSLPNVIILSYHSVLNYCCNWYRIVKYRRSFHQQMWQ